MNRKIKSFTILVLGLLVASIYFSALTQGALLSDQLEVTTGSYVKGKYLFTNDTHNDLLMAYITLTVEDIWNDTSSLLNIVQFHTLYEFEGDENPLGMDDDITQMEMTSLVFEHNRTIFLPAARLYMGNATFSAIADITYLKNDLSDMFDLYQANLTIDGVSYIFDDLVGDEDNYADYAGIMLAFLLINAIILSYSSYTPLAINTVANVADTVNYEPTDGRVDELEPITTSEGVSYDCINVEYDDAFTFLTDDLDEVDAHYEVKTGLLIRSIEKDTVTDEQYEFQPVMVDIETTFLPFPIAGAIVSIVAIGLVIVVSRKRK